MKPWDLLPFSWWDRFAALMPLVKRYLPFPVCADGDTGWPIRLSPRRVEAACPPQQRGLSSCPQPPARMKGACSLELAFKPLLGPAPREITASPVPQQLISLTLLFSFLKVQPEKLNLGYLISYGDIRAGRAMDYKWSVLKLGK